MSRKLIWLASVVALSGMEVEAKLPIIVLPHYKTTLYKSAFDGSFRWRAKKPGIAKEFEYLMFRCKPSYTETPTTVCEVSATYYGREKVNVKFFHRDTYMVDAAGKRIDPLFSSLPGEGPVVMNNGKDSGHSFTLSYGEAAHINFNFPPMAKNDLIPKLVVDGIRLTDIKVK